MIIKSPPKKKNNHKRLYVVEKENKTYLNIRIKIVDNIHYRTCKLSQ